MSQDRVDRCCLPVVEFPDKGNVEFIAVVAFVVGDQVTACLDDQVGCLVAQPTRQDQVPADGDVEALDEAGNVPRRAASAFAS